MTNPVLLETRRFLLVAKQRLDDAQFLLGHRNTASIYLAGYAVECALKALLLSVTTASKIPNVLESFRCQRGHHLEWLKLQVVRQGGSTFPPSIARKFARVNSWTTDLRYHPGRSSLGDAAGFFEAAEEIVRWASKRL